MRSSLGKVQTVNSEIGMKQSKISSMINQQENLVSNLNQETLESSRRAGIMQSSVESRMGELGDRVEEIRDMDINSIIPSGVIHSLNNTIMDGAPS